MCSEVVDYSFERWVMQWRISALASTFILRHFKRSVWVGCAVFLFFCIVFMLVYTRELCDFYDDGEYRS